MSVRKRVWTTKGERREAWIVDYVDTKNVRRLKTFAKKKDADQFSATAKVEVRDGVHVADRATVTVSKAGKFWLASGDEARLERSTMNQRKRHLTLHIEPFIGSTLLSKLTVPAIRDFEDKLRAQGRTAVMVKKVVGSLGAIITDGQERGLITRNPVKDIRGTRRRGREKQAERRQKARLLVGTDIPAPNEIKAFVGKLSGRWRPLFLTLIFTGVRSSELRGLRWQDVDLEGRSVSVRQRADEFGDIGRPKSGAGERTIPVPPMVVNALREWRLGYSRPVKGRDNEGNPIREDARPSHLIFANGNGKVESHANIISRGLVPTMIAAGVTVDTGDLNKDGKPILAAKYTGLHALRHFYASWLINRPQEGGLGLPLKVVQERMGHSSITMTADVYGHLFPRTNDADELAAAEAALLG
ncbi:tyrosine-type recombinase/integrase [Mesorhizobium denitrificans]|uniref:Site-specific integrase n=1 Tax=Mesorhizobium denitrificans TaxID=2294114 RepID=A0A371XFA3_9HYPH|nr:site-specific integrase [Mesorhizobium denitrificans]RFC67704.1 site-specific integrase [Mesorhizobium denitrificans]